MAWHSENFLTVLSRGSGSYVNSVFFMCPFALDKVDS